MHIIINRWTRRDLLALIGVLLIAAVLRFAQLDVTDYHYDQAKLVGMAQDLIAGKHFPTEGLPASMGFPAPPTMDFLIALPYLFSSNPLFVESFIIVLNLVGIALLYWIAQRYFSRTIGLIAALTYACNPWAIQFSRQIWPPHFITPFVLASITCGLLGFVEGRRWAQVLTLPLLVIAVSSHYGVTALLTVFGWFLWRKRVYWLAVALSLVITVIILSPFLAGFTGAPMTSIRAALNRNHTGTQVVRPAYAVVARFASGAGVERAFGLASTDYTDQLPLVFWIIAATPVVIGLIAVRSHPLAPLIYLWSLSAALILTLLPITAYDHYMVTSIPALCLLAGIGLNALAVRLHPVIFVPGAVILVMECFLWFNLVNTARNVPTSEFGPPFANLLPIRQQLTSASDVIIVGGATGISGSDVWSTLLFRTATCVRELIVADGGITVFPAHPFTLLVAPNASPPGAPYISTKTTEFPLRSGEGVYTVGEFDTPLTWTGPTVTSTEPARFNNGVVLNGYTFADQRLYLDWTLPAATSYDYQYFAHLLNANGDKVAQHDASFYSGKYWCDNDRVITWMGLDRPADAVTLRVGMYRLENSQIIGSSTVDSAGNTTPWVDIPLAAN